LASYLPRRPTAEGSDVRKTLYETYLSEILHSATPMQRSDVEDWRSDMSLFNIGFIIFPDLIGEARESTCTV
jgi:hypothetical protein